jgi:pimeloyl-ACP methyl ester carboxylesterase
MPYATAKDGCELYYEVRGKEDGQALFVNYPWTDALAKVNAAMGIGTEEENLAKVQSLMTRLGEHYMVVHFDFPRGSGRTARREHDVTADTVASDYVTLADAAGVDRFVALGYSWSGNAVLQVACRTNRCAGVAIGGWPPLGGPYDLMLEYMNTRKTRTMRWGLRIATGSRLIGALIGKKKRDALKETLEAMKSAINYYMSVVGKWDERAAVTGLTGPRITIFGSDDQGMPQMKLDLPLAENNRTHRKELEQLGWQVVELEGYDHISLLETEAGADAFVTTLLRELEPHHW